MDKGIAFAGNLIADKVKYVDAYPERTTLRSILSVADSTGGLACNCSIGMAKLAPDIPLTVLGLVGEDAVGDYVLAQLNAQPSIDTGGVGRQGTTSFTDVITEPDGARTFLTYRGANAQFGPQHIDFGKLDVSLLHIGYILLLDTLDGPDPDYPTAMCRVLHSAQQAGIATSVDVVSENSNRFSKIVPPALKYTDYCCINELEAEHSCGVALRSASGKVIESNLRAACEKLLELGVARGVAIHMPELSCAMDAAGTYIQEESWYIPAGFKKSSVGAGDAFAVGMLLGAYRGWGIEEALHTAGAVAAHSLNGAGGTDAILPLNELMARMEALKP